MVKAGTIDQAKYDALPIVKGPPVLPTAEQTAKLGEYLAKNWASAVK